MKIPEGYKKYSAKILEKCPRNLMGTLKNFKKFIKTFMKLKKKTFDYKMRINLKRC